MKQYYLHLSGSTYGPYPEDQLIDLVKNGEVSKASLICEAGGEDWVQAQTILPKSAKPVAVAVTPPIDNPKSNEKNDGEIETVSESVAKSEEKTPNASTQNKESSTPTTSETEPISYTATDVKDALSSIKIPIIVCVFAILIPILFYMVKMDILAGEQVKTGTTTGAVKQFLKDYTNRMPEVLGLGAACLVYGLMSFGKQLSYYLKVNASFKGQKSN